MACISSRLLQRQPTTFRFSSILRLISSAWPVAIERDDAAVELGGPIVLVWDNLRMHLVEPLREFIAATTTGSPSSGFPTAHLT